MRVALDASFLHLPPSGTGTYVRHLVDALRTEDPALDLRLLHPPWAARNTSAPPSRRDRLAWELWGVTTAARQHHSDVVHVPHFSAPIVSPGAPLVVTAHDAIPLVLEPYRASRAMRARLAIVRQTVKRARIVITPSHHAASDIKRLLHVSASGIRVIPEAADGAYRPATDDTERRAATAVGERLGVRGRYIFNAGGYDVRKNLPVLLEAFALALPRLRQPVALVIAGAPHSRNQAIFPPLGPVIERHGLTDKVILTGFVTERDKLALYQAASLYVTPSSYEGFGLTPLEAMACGIPTIAADRTSLPEVVGAGGILVPPEVVPVSDAIVRVLTNDPLAGELARRAVARAATFSWRDTARQTLAAYRDAAGG